MRWLAGIVALAGCMGGSSIRVVESARVDQLELVVRSCSISVNNEGIKEGACGEERQRLPVVVDMREVPVIVSRDEAQQLAAGLARTRYALRACAGAATVEVVLRIDDTGRAVGADAGADRIDVASCVIKTLEDIRFPAAQRGSQAVLAVAAKATP